MNTKESTSHRLSDKCKELLRLLAAYHGVSQTDIIELAVREKAQRDLKNTTEDA
jgi:hypothetical protein